MKKADVKVIQKKLEEKSKYHLGHKINDNETQGILY